MDETTEEKSELESLLETNAYVRELTNAEFLRALQLIASPEYEETLCWVCKMYNKENQSIYDTYLCQGHARYALATRK